MIQTIADTLNGWATALNSLATRIEAFVISKSPDFEPITVAIANVQAAIDALAAMVTTKE